ncbi:MAG: hypothetical protein J6T26_07725 [Firmicutes bacterium]|nr:hypothetical protein [Bacillota bacterium]
MKVKKIRALCKARGTCYLFDELTQGGEISRQWISNGAAMWPVSGLPMLSEANLSTLFDFSESTVEKMKIAEKELPGWLCGVSYDLRDGETQLQESNIRLRVDGEELMALTAGATVYWLRADYLKPCWTKETQLILRRDEDGEAVIAVCDGLFLAGIVMPAVLQPEVFRELLRLGVSAPKPVTPPEETPEDEDDAGE